MNTILKKEADKISKLERELDRKKYEHYLAVEKYKIDNLNTTYQSKLDIILDNISVFYYRKTSYFDTINFEPSISFDNRGYHYTDYNYVLDILKIILKKRNVLVTMFPIFKYDTKNNKVIVENSLDRKKKLLKDDIDNLKNQINVFNSHKNFLIAKSNYFKTKGKIERGGIYYQDEIKEFLKDNPQFNHIEVFKIIDNPIKLCETSKYKFQKFDNIGFTIKCINQILNKYHKVIIYQVYVLNGELLINFFVINKNV